MEQILLGAVLRHTEDGVVQDSFTKGRCCLTRLVASCGGVATSVDAGEAADVCRGFRKASDRVGLIMLLPNNTKDIRLLVCVRGRATEVGKASGARLGRG